mgnify:CR=1 FL=1
MHVFFFLLVLIFFRFFFCHRNFLQIHVVPFKAIFLDCFWGFSFLAVLERPLRLSSSKASSCRSNRILLVSAVVKDVDISKVFSITFHPFIHPSVFSCWDFHSNDISSHFAWWIFGGKKQCNVLKIFDYTRVSSHFCVRKSIFTFLVRRLILLFCPQVVPQADRVLVKLEELPEVTMLY